jgi:hypothetical protein
VTHSKDSCPQAGHLTKEESLWGSFFPEVYLGLCGEALSESELSALKAAYCLSEASFMPLSDKQCFFSLGASALDFFFGSFFCIKAKEKNRQLLTESDDERGKVS